MTEEEFRSLVIRDLGYVKGELATIRRGTPGASTIACGVFLGLVVYSVVGVVCTIVLWGLIFLFLGAMGARAEAERLQREMVERAFQNVPRQTTPATEP